MKTHNRVTERALLSDRIYVVSAEWRGGHNHRKVSVENVHSDYKSAMAEWSGMTKEAHNAAYGRDADYDSGHIRHPIREYALRSKIGGAEDNQAEVDDAAVLAFRSRFFDKRDKSYGAELRQTIRALRAALQGEGGTS